MIGPTAFNSAIINLRTRPSIRVEIKHRIVHFAQMDDLNALATKHQIPPLPEGHSFLVAALYKFIPIEAPEDLRGRLASHCLKHGITGTILLAREGINGTICGSREGITHTIDWLRARSGLADLSPKYSFADAPAFLRMKVRLKKEIVTMGEPEIDPLGCVGRYVAPSDWDDLIADPDTLLIDTRNNYEVAIGTFKGAVNPKTETFREFPKWVDRYLENLPDHSKPKKIAMFCTGGIRCEKATSYLVERGYENVFHLEGGILKYLETMPEDQSSWDGDCFVFDQRVSVRHGLALGNYDLCHACRMPISEEDKRHNTYVPGISCPKCHAQMSDEQRQRFAERQKQIELARERGDTHLGRKVEP